MKTKNGKTKFENYFLIFFCCKTINRNLNHFINFYKAKNYFCKLFQKARKNGAEISFVK